MVVLLVFSWCPRGGGSWCARGGGGSWCPRGVLVEVVARGGNRQKNGLRFRSPPTVKTFLKVHYINCIQNLKKDI